MEDFISTIIMRYDINNKQSEYLSIYEVKTIKYFYLFMK